MEGEGCAPPPTIAKKSRNANCFPFTKNKAGFECRRYKNSNFNKIFPSKNFKQFPFKGSATGMVDLYFSFLSQILYFPTKEHYSKQITPNAQLISKTVGGDMPLFLIYLFLSYSMKT